MESHQRFVGKNVAKGVGVSWRKLNAEQRRAMNEAMQLELKDWISNKVCRAAVGHVPRERIVKMRWVLVFKDTSAKGSVKAKARLVVLGYTPTQTMPTSTPRALQFQGAQGNFF